MLRITQSESSEAAKNYFGQSLSRGDYYMEGQEIAGNWGGHGAERLGLVGRVEQEAFVALLDNRRPDGQRLTARTVANRRPGYDFTFDVPKSVSVIFALARDERIIGAMQRAIAETMQEMEVEMHARVRKNGAFSDRKTGSLIWAEFLHLTSRPASLDRATEATLKRSWTLPEHPKDEAGRIVLPDPHLHAHVYVLNATYDDVEEMWKAGEFMRLKRDASYYQAAYHSRLAGELQKLGYEIEPTANAFEIAGVPRSVNDVFSRRTREIEEAARELGITSDAEKDSLGALTRRGKNVTLSMSELRAVWRLLLKADEVSKLETIAASARGIERAFERDSPDAAAAGIKYALGHELERVSVVSERRVLARALMRSVGQSRVSTVRGELPKTPGLLCNTVDDERHVTTRTILAEESALMQFVRGGRGRVAALDIRANGVSSVAGMGMHAGRQTYQFRTPFLRVETKENKEQRAAVLHVLGSQDWIVGVVGRAGTGKTTLLHEVDAAVTGAGKKLILCAPTAEASRGVLRDEGFSKADTVKGLLLNEGLRGRIRGNVLWVDEAGMVGNRDMLALLNFAKKEGVARVVLAGDPTQIRSVPRGDALAFLEKNAGLSVVRLERIKRQRSPELRTVVDAISRGNVELGLELLDRGGHIFEAEAKEAWRALAVSYSDKIAEHGGGASALVISPTHSEGEAITKAIRDELCEKGVIAKNEEVIQRTANLSWTKEERGSASNYEPGLVVQFKANVRGFRKGERVRVEEVNARAQSVLVRKNDGTERVLPLKAADRFQVYAVRELPVAVGDRLKVTENSVERIGERSVRFNNGDLVRVTGFTPEGDMVLDDKKVMPRHFGHLTHGYVVTADTAQAKTVDSVFIGIGQDSMATTDLRRIYVAVSRARDDVRVFTDDKAGLIQSAKRDNERLSATELIGAERSREILNSIRMREAHRQQEALRGAPARNEPRLNPPARSREREIEMDYGR